MEYIAIKFNNCDRSTGLLLKVKTVKEMITKFVLNTVLHHVGLSWIISSNKQLKYETKENNHHEWLNKAPRPYFLNSMKLCLMILLDMIEHTYAILCVLYLEMIHYHLHMLIIQAVSAVEKYLCMQQQQH